MLIETYATIGIAVILYLSNVTLFPFVYKTINDCIGYLMKESNYSYLFVYVKVPGINILISLSI